METLPCAHRLEGKYQASGVENHQAQVDIFKAAPEKSYKEQSEDILRYQIKAMRDSVFMPTICPSH